VDGAACDSANRTSGSALPLLPQAADKLRKPEDVAAESATQTPQQLPRCNTFAARPQSSHLREFPKNDKGDPRRGEITYN